MNEISKPNEKLSNINPKNSKTRNLGIQTSFRGTKDELILWRVMRNAENFQKMKKVTNENDT